MFKPVLISHLTGLVYYVQTRVEGGFYVLCGRCALSYFPVSLFADVNECEDNSGDCEHHCINEVGGYRCTCKQGFKLRGDNRTCESETTITDPDMNAQAAHRDRCYANCETVHRLHDKLKALQEKVNIKLVLNAGSLVC